MVTWLKLIYDLRGNDQTSVLVAAAHSKLIEIWILIPLGLIHSSYGSLRTAVDICTSYTFYYSHPVEWAAVCEGRASWQSRSAVVDWHIRHTPFWRELNDAFGLSDRLHRNYRDLSSYVHGVPTEGLPTLRGIERITIPEQEVDKFVQTATKTDFDISLLFLSVFYKDLASLASHDLMTVTAGVDRKKLSTAGIVIPKP